MRGEQTGPGVATGVVEGLIEGEALDEGEVSVGSGLLLEGGDEEAVEVGVGGLDGLRGALEIGWDAEGADEAEEAGDEAEHGDGEDGRERWDAKVASGLEKQGGGDGGDGPCGREREGGAAPDLALGDGPEQSEDGVLFHGWAGAEWEGKGFMRPRRGRRHVGQ